MHRRRLATSLLTGSLVLAVTACGAGRDPETYRARPTVDAALASIGELELRNVTIVPPADGEAEIGVGKDAVTTLSIINLGERPDRLVQVSSPAATSVELLDSEGTVATSVDVGKLAALGPEDFSLTLRGLTAGLRPGQSVELTFTFANNGRKTLLVPVGVYTSPVPAPEHNVFEEVEGGGEGEEPAEGAAADTAEEDAKGTTEG